MQQTEKLKLNLIETGDHLSPAPLNENAEKIEAALDGQDVRLTVLEARRFVFGTYTGDGQHSQFIGLGFTPIVVIAIHISTTNPCSMAVQGQPTGGAALKIAENGFEALNISSEISRNMNSRTQPVNYIAFG